MNFNLLNNLKQNNKKQQKTTKNNKKQQKTTNGVKEKATQC